MSNLVAQLASALFQNPANPVRDEQDARRLAQCALAAAALIEKDTHPLRTFDAAFSLDPVDHSGFDTTAAVTLKAPFVSGVNPTTRQASHQTGLSLTTLRRQIRGYESVFGPLPQSGREKLLPPLFMIHVIRAQAHSRASRTGDRADYWRGLDR